MARHYIQVPKNIIKKLAFINNKGMNDVVAIINNLTNEICDHVQNERGINIVMDRSRDKLLTEFGKATLIDRYLLEGEGFQDMFARVAMHYADDSPHAQRIYEYISKLWFMPSTPILSNGGTKRGLPISCFLNEANDDLHSIVDIWNENVWLAARGGGIGSYWGNLRSIGEKIGKNGKTSGIVPFICVMDSLTLAISQGSLRRGSSAAYLPVWHPEIEEFIELRRPTGGDPNRRALNLHHGVLLTDDFMRAVENNDEWSLISPKDKSVIRKIMARDLWIRILTARIETGEPYCIFIDHVNRAIPEHQKLQGLTVKSSNLCAEITLPTGLDKNGKHRTAVCCLASLNVEKWPEWEKNDEIIDDIMRFLDNVLQDFIDNAPPEFNKASYAAARERSVGLGIMGYHSFLQSMNIPMESVMAKTWNKRIFKHISQKANISSISLAKEKEPCLDAAEFNIDQRFSNKIAIAPTASISIICGGTSPGIEPIAANSYTHKTLSGSFVVRNHYLQSLLVKKGKDNGDIWSSIAVNGGSVQHLDFLSDDEKDVFKTAFEIDQRWLIGHAADRTPMICQSQSLNLFIPADISKRDLHQLHFRAWKKGIKSLYYCRSKSIQRAEASSEYEITANMSMMNNDGNHNFNDFDECLSCQ